MDHMVEPLAFINQRLQGAHNLLHATHNYIKWQAPLDVKHMDHQKIFKVSSEAMRVTVRMTQIIAWFMLQKAVLSGELSRQEALSDEFRVLQGKPCLEDEAESDEDLPPRLRELLKESHDLYIHVLRLDEMFRKEH